MTDVKQQHFLPQFYLRLFVDADGFLHVVRRCDGQLGSPYKGKPDRVCSKKYLHEVRRRFPIHGEEFFEKGAIEAGLGKVESALAPNYLNLLRCLENGSLPNDFPGTIEGLIALIAFIVARTPEWLQLKRDEAGDDATKLMEKYSLGEGDIGRMPDGDSQGEFEALVELSIMDAALFSTADGAPMRALVELMFDKNCRFLKSQDGTAFITASSPVYAQWVSEEDKDPAAIYFPLSPRFAAVFNEDAGDESIRIEDASIELVASLNRTLMNGNDIWETLMASDGDVLNSLLKDYRLSR